MTGMIYGHHHRGKKMLAFIMKAIYHSFIAFMLKALRRGMRNEAKIQLRLPAEVRDWFKEFADRNSRSMNGQMIELIKERREAEAEKGKAPNA
ncbi:Arc family DNA-binding protein [Burkholderia vietnamiensis]|uniref:Arc family DNA-binding protein n=1 Tax=Burkholderia vietnamiensis TaxID=60552 RepID=UPI0015947742|nr:Arc family DNA-binding protein [Burkholderia vietnamiensis]